MGANSPARGRHRSLDFVARTTPPDLKTVAPAPPSIGSLQQRPITTTMVMCVTRPRPT